LLLLFARPLGKFLLTLVLPFIYSFIILHPKPNSNREEKRNHQRLPRTLPAHCLSIMLLLLLMLIFMKLEQWQHYQYVVPSSPIPHIHHTQSIVYSSSRLYAPIYQLICCCVATVLQLCLSNHRTYTVQYSTSYIRSHTHNHTTYHTTPRGIS